MRAGPDELQRRLNDVTATAKQLSLTFNANKCKTMHFRGETPAGCRDTAFTIEGREIPTLANHEQVTFLGKEFGYRTLTSWATLAEYMNTGEKILTSSLAPWQRLDALKTFLYPSTQVALRTGALTKTEWSKLDEFLRPLIKRTLKVPIRASNEYLYGERKKGCLGIPLTAEDSDVVTSDSAFKLLTSPDPAIRALATEDLNTTTRTEWDAPPTRTTSRHT